MPQASFRKAENIGLTQISSVVCSLNSKRPHEIRFLNLIKTTSICGLISDLNQIFGNAFQSEQSVLISFFSSYLGHDLTGTS